MTTADPGPRLLQDTVTDLAQFRCEMTLDQREQLNQHCRSLPPRLVSLLREFQGFPLEAKRKEANP